MRTIVVMCITAAACAVAFFAVQYADLIFSGAKMRWASGTLFGSYLSVSSVPTDIIFFATLLLGVIATYSEVRRRRAQRRRWSLRVVDGSAKNQDARENEGCGK